MTASSTLIAVPVAAAAGRLNSGVSAHSMSSQTQPTNPEQTLSELLLGATVSGVRFGALQLLLEPACPIGECYINLTSAWHVYAALPSPLPDNEADVPELTEEQEVLSLASLRGSAVTSVAISPGQHLLVGFSNDSWLYVNGNNPGPEPWSAGLSGMNRQDSVMVVALSGSWPIVYQPNQLSANNSFKPNPLRGSA